MITTKKKKTTNIQKKKWRQNQNGTIQKNSSTKEGSIDRIEEKNHIEKHRENR